MIYVDETIIPTKGKYRNQKTPFRIISKDDQINKE